VTETPFASGADVPWELLSANVGDLASGRLESAASFCGGELDDCSDWNNDEELGNCFE
jgi:hypothetical protein